jgi:hypothetical protein
MSPRGGFARPAARAAACILATAVLLAARPARGAVLVAYAGSLDDPKAMPTAVERLYQVFRTDIGEPDELPCEYVTKADADGKPFVCGIRFRPSKSVEWVELAFSAEGRIDGEVDTEALGFRAHQALINMLHEVRRVAANLQVRDPTLFWDRGNAEDLRIFFERATVSPEDEARAEIERQRWEAEQASGKGISGALAALAVIALGLYLLVMAIKGARG